MEPHDAPAEEDDQLFHVGFNDDKPDTIVLLPGLLSSHLEYQYVVPGLSGFHILAVDLNGHSGSSHVQPVTLAGCADKVAALIRAKAHGGRCHLVGLSMGGYVAMTVATTHTGLVKSLFVTGAAPLQGSFKWMAERPSVVWFLMNALIWYMPTWLYTKMGAVQGLKPHQDLLGEMRKNLKWETVQTALRAFLGLAGTKLQRFRSEHWPSPLVELTM